jgi:flagellar basal-body rod modification protein FlgD
MDLSKINSVVTQDFLNNETPARPTGQKVLNVDDFLKLITVQLTSQDPMKPMEDTQFISQMSSFTSLEQMKGLSKDFADFTAGQKITSAQNLIGKNVTLSLEGGDITGDVTGVNLGDGTPQLIVNGKQYDPADITSIRALSALR